VEIDTDKIDEAVLALLFLTLHARCVPTVDVCLDWAGVCRRDDGRALSRVLDVRMAISSSFVVDGLIPKTAHR
jgi:hypothetical protein